ncbi:hypothetical protein [Lactiplantibacillus mudanjiangensis]|uniref:Uncharacterized protein n=1 Tax=Lactiplantibacillus mudanjiangensis TaxID=1296538 RepID=A0A660EBG3_9LACO|nr:hypothetical protein [Lactiplantibacillus mudanjiangensis]VDG19113.1 hypothetical protein [Lactobacillus sp. CBA3605] [Lactiplantibacillus mudanjiangensis]VDG23187.1 hypothetical protein [Lactobacillus sp. CBA3605] [Lactiplantibacillus mudanjiangensis]VDG29886.1 hypothetical protein [Lactobacillus sp. CBA3605] [Lactiplantibacillus mudanjiangensis]VDG33185.1 hypothetical protein [Lactobacillus sp. CBA3605] [Lactiplantibacillus mudanjiangensis]
MSSAELTRTFNYLRQQLIVWAVTAVGLAVMRTFILPQLLTWVFWGSVVYCLLLFIALVIVTIMRLRAK